MGADFQFAEGKAKMPAASGRKADHAALAVMIEQNRARCLAPKPEPAQANPWIALGTADHSRIQKVERTRRGQPKGNIRRRLSGEKRRRLAPDQARIDIAGAESFELAKRREELAIGDEARNPGLV